MTDAYTSRGLPLASVVVAEPQSFRDARTPRLDHDVHACRERASLAGCALVREVEHDAALPPSPERPRRLTAEAAPAGGLDQHHVGADVGEETADVGARQRTREVDHARAGERAPHPVVHTVTFAESPREQQVGVCRV